MGREIKRVPLDFDFPIGEGYHDAAYEKHEETCELEDHDDCEVDTSPPKGEGWQLWQTVSDGPISPVFDTPEKLINFMCQPATDPRYGPYPDMPWGQGWKRETAERFVRGPGWMPSMMMVGGRVLSTDELVADIGAKK